MHLRQFLHRGELIVESLRVGGNDYKVIYTHKPTVTVSDLDFQRDV